MDESVVRRVQAGDREAFEALIVGEHRRLFTLAHGILRDAHAAEDATQQAFLDIWRGIGHLRDLARFEAWSYRLLVRVCYREAKRRQAQASPAAAIAGVPVSPDPFGNVIERDRLERAFGRLSLDHRSVVVMRYLLDMEPEHIATTLSIPRRTVYSRLRRALAALRAALDADERVDVHGLDRREVTG